MKNKRLKIACCVFFSVMVCLLTSCSPSFDFDLDAAAKKGVAVVDPYQEGWLTKLTQDEIASRLGIESSLYQSSSVYTASKSTSAYTVAGFQASENNQAELSEAMETAKEQIIASFNGFLPDQYEIAQNAVIKQYGDYFFLIVSDRNDEVIEAIETVIYPERDPSSASEAA